MTTSDLIYPGRLAIRYKTMLFPDGQPHIKINIRQAEGINRAAPLRVLTRLNNPSDLVLASFVKNTLDYPGV